MKRTRSHGAVPEVGTSGSGSQPSLRKRAAAGPGVSVCITCHGRVTWKDEAHAWVAYDHSTLTPHRCKP